MKMDAYPFNVWLQEVAPRTFPHSLWVYGLVGLSYLVVLTLVLCTANWFFRRRQRLRGMGEVLVHLGFLLIFAGFVLGSGFGTRVQGVAVPVGGEAAVGDTGLTLRVDNVDFVRGPAGRVWDTVSEVAVLRGGQTLASGTTRTNHPLIWGSTVVYPQGAQSLVRGATVATSEGVVQVGIGQDTALTGGGRLSIRGVLNPGDRRGPYFGPGVLLAQLGSHGQVLGSAYLSPGMGSPVDLGGVRARLVDLDVVPNGVYNVHHDPGVILVLIGAVTLTAGTFWSLTGYLRGRRLFAET
jgi:cytochrome c biogenesis factor